MVDANNVPVMDGQGNKTFQYQKDSAQLYGAEATLSIHPIILKGQGINVEYLPFIPPLKVLSTLNHAFKIKTSRLKSVSLNAEVDYNAS